MTTRDFSTDELTSAGDFATCHLCGFSSREEFLFRFDDHLTEQVCSYGYGCDNDRPTGRDLFDAYKDQRDGALERAES